MIDWSQWMAAVVYRVNHARLIYTTAILSPLSLALGVIARVLISMLSVCLVCGIVARFCLGVLMHAPFVVGVLIVAPVVHSSLLLPVALLVAAGPAALLVVSVTSFLIMVCALNCCVGCTKGLLLFLRAKIWD